MSTESRRCSADLNPRAERIRIYSRRAKQTCSFAESGDIYMGELLQPGHLVVILIVAFLFFGGKKLPELGAGLGKGIKSFKESMREMTADHDKIETTSARQPEATEKKQAEPVEKS
jgi:sec-independent protein translocase protein TatA